MESNLLWQYIAVFAITLGAIAWIIYRLVSKKHRNAGSSCCGCSLADTCVSKDKGKNSTPVPPKTDKCCCCDAAPSDAEEKKKD